MEVGGLQHPDIRKKAMKPRCGYATKTSNTTVSRRRTGDSDVKSMLVEFGQGAL